MLTHVTIRNYQSLHEVTIELSPFTVIVGPSSSGKSAFTRALRTLTSNQRGDAFITHGETQTVIQATTERGTVALMRGKKNEYVIVPEEGDSQTFTKLAGNTPEEVSSFIGIPSKDPLNYASQFDMPYLLTNSAGEVARTLGDLTNVSIIFEASREANRQRLQASGTLKTRAEDYTRTSESLEKFGTLEEDEAILTAVGEILTRAREIQDNISGLEIQLQRIKPIPAVPQRVSLDLGTLSKKYEKIKRLENLITSYSTQLQSHADAVERARKLEIVRDTKHAEYNQALREAGSCPTCGSDTGHVH